MRPLNLVISIIMVLAIQPAFAAEKTDLSSEATAQSHKDEVNTGTLADERMTHDEARKAAYNIFLGGGKPQTPSESKTQTQK